MKLYQRGPNLEVDFRYTNFCLASDPPPPPRYTINQPQSKGLVGVLGLATGPRRCNSDDAYTCAYLHNPPPPCPPRTSARAADPRHPAAPHGERQGTPPACGHGHAPPPPRRRDGPSAPRRTRPPRSIPMPLASPRSLHNPRRSPPPLAGACLSGVHCPPRPVPRRQGPGGARPTSALEGVRSGTGAPRAAAGGLESNTITPGPGGRGKLEPPPTTTSVLKRRPMGEQAAMPHTYVCLGGVLLV